MTYVSAHISLTRAQKLKLAKGLRVRVALDQLNAGSTIHLTKQQNTRMLTAIRHNRGFLLQFSPAHVAHLIGSGIWDDIKDAVGKAIHIGKKVKEVYDAVAPVVEHGVNAYKTISAMRGKK